MKRMVLVALMVALSTSAFAKKRPSVVIPKPLPVLQPLAIPLMAVPPLLVLYDLDRRINCLNPPDPLGLGGPGFDGNPTPPSNVMISCYERRYNAGRPAPR